VEAPQRDGYVAALRFPALNRLFDPVVRATMRESRFRRDLLRQAAIEPGHSVLDLGCGTGTLAVMAKSAEPAAEVIGLDGGVDCERPSGHSAFWDQRTAP
jgi:2-polyprenyl-3-methyl-5-hydroxy-6-metoxy-1,4-benzoquinol methylase